MADKKLSALAAIAAIADGDEIYVRDISEGVPADQSKRTLFSNLIDSIRTFTSVVTGLVPASGGGTTNFLRADGTFAAPGLDNDVIELIEVAGGQVFGAGTSKVTFDTTRLNTDSGVFAVAIDEIEVLVAGTYRIDTGLAGDYSGISVLHQIIIQVDIGAGFVELPGTAKELNNNTGTTTGSMHAAANVTFAANDKIRITIVRLSASGNWTVDPNAGQFSVTRLL